MKDFDFFGFFGLVVIFVSLAFMMWINLLLGLAVGLIIAFTQDIL